MNTPITAEESALLRRLGTATLYEAQGQHGAMDSGIKPLAPGFFLAGRALTVDVQPGDNLFIHEAVRAGQPGDVLVVDAKGYTEAGAWGDVLTKAALCAGFTGLIIDGAVRDVDTIIEMGFPVFSRAVSIKGTSKSLRGRVGTPVVCGGATVRTTDVVVGDRDGVVVLPADGYTESIRLGIQREEKEEAMRRALESGQNTVDLLGLRTALEVLSQPG